MNQPRLNEFELDDAWQRGVFDRLLRPVLREHAYENGIVFVDIASPVASMLQRQAHIDVLVQLPEAKMMSLEIKLVRFPGARQGSPGRYHWRDLFLETYSCTVPGHEARGWMATSKADILLWGQVSLNEDSINCWPLPFAPLRKWMRAHFYELPERDVPNVINGCALRTRGRLAPIQKLCSDLKIEGFKVNDSGIIADLWGKPLLHFNRDGNWTSLGDAANSVIESLCGKARAR
jgi:hypothetical protein